MAERIEFSLVVGSEDVFPRPYPASREVPQWFKSMPAQADNLGEPIATLKNCPPFIEAMTCGYIIPLAANITLSLDANGVFHGHGATRYSQSRFADIIQIHRPPQVQGSPFENCPAVKILNPWLIRTPPGHSALFLPVLNRFLMPLSPLAGLVETDIFYREVNFPAILSLPPGRSLTLPRGTPLVQVIPIPRDDYQSEIVPLDAESYKTSRPETLPANHNLNPDSENFYRNNYWIKKNYH